MVYKNSLASGTILSGLRNGTSDFYLEKVSADWKNLPSGLYIKYKYTGKPEYTGTVYVSRLPSGMVGLNRGNGSPMGYVKFNISGMRVHFQDQTNGSGQIIQITAG